MNFGTNMKIVLFVIFVMLREIRNSVTAPNSNILRSMMRDTNLSTFFYPE